MKTSVIVLIAVFISVNAFALNTSANTSGAFKSNSAAAFTKLQNPGTETPTTFDKLPQKVQDSFHSNHKNSKVKSAAVIDNKGVKKYEISYASGKKTYKAYYDENGKKVK